MKSVNERIVASMITTLFITGAVTSFGLGVYAGSQQYLAEQALDDNFSKQSEIYDMVKQTSIYQNEYSAKFNYYSTEYAQNRIDYNEYAKQISYLRSNQFVEDIIDLYGNDELNSKLHTIQLQGKDLQYISSSCTKVMQACAFTTGVSGLIGCAGITHSFAQNLQHSTDTEECTQ